MVTVVDHLVKAVPDLEGGIVATERLLGCYVIPGGRHEN
jgi:hypothetical protein